VTAGRQRDVIDSVDTLNKLHQDSVDDPEIATRISQYEMAFKMQTSVPALMNLSAESEETLKLYGTKGADGSFAATASSPGGSPSAACGSSSSTTATGTTTAASKTGIKLKSRKWTAPARR
jgi:hypothetical protein